MNAEDFRRNFAQSFLAVQPSAIATSLKAAGVWDNADFTGQRPMIPCTTPSFTNNGQVHLAAVVKCIDDTYKAVPVTLTWKNDLDQDTSICDSRHPRIGMVNNPDSIAFLRRFPQRSYNRGYAPRACSIHIPNSYTADACRTTTHAVIWSVYNPDYKKLPEALDILDAGRRIGVVLAPYLGICLEQGRKYPRLAYQTDIIGFIQNGDPVIYDYVTEDARDYIIKITGKIPKIK